MRMLRPSGEEAILTYKNRTFKFVFPRYYDAKDGRYGKRAKKNPIFLVHIPIIWLQLRDQPNVVQGLKLGGDD